MKLMDAKVVDNFDLYSSPFRGSGAAMSSTHCEK